MPYPTGQKSKGRLYYLKKGLIGLGGYAASRVFRSAANYAGKKVIDKSISAVQKWRKQRPKTMKKAKTKLARRVQTLEKRVSNSEGTLIYRRLLSSRLLASQNAVNHGAFSSNYTTNIELALAQLRYFNPATPGTYTTVDLTSGTNSKAVSIQCKSYMTVSNNYQVPVKVTLYCVAPKVDHSVTPTAAIDNGLSDASAGPLTITSPTVHPTDSYQFNDLWRIKQSKSKYLRPGQKLTLAYSTKWFEYDPALVDTHNDIYQRRNHAMVYLVRVQGPMGHDTVADQQGLLPCGVDTEHYLKYTVKYQAGVRVKFYVESLDLDAMTTSAVVSEAPVADNIAYSVS